MPRIQVLNQFRLYGTVCVTEVISVMVGTVVTVAAVTTIVAVVTEG